MCCAALRQIGACVSGLPGFCGGHICGDKPCQRQAAALGILSASTQSLPETCGGFVSAWRIRSSMQFTLFPITSNAYSDKVAHSLPTVVLVGLRRSFISRF